MNMVSKLSLFCLFGLVLPVTGIAEPLTSRPDIIYSKLEEVTKMREGLASTLDGKNSPITVEDFKRVCAPVGVELKSWAQQNGFKVRQVSTRFRNPDHRPTELEHEAIAKLSADRSLKRLELRSRKSEVPGRYYFAPIQVTSSCLSCHGDVAKLPEFILKSYPSDRANGFKVGDLRGIYSVFVPDGSKPPRQ